ncbi:hypothetical protein ABZU75_23360 [Streptosporangium sp. NPDC005286]|uniref:hypothetical protein n=1 Tax=Streptosporangium sp. NPDC005286 TaxID=3154463 RepID=UPI00339E8E2C
MTAADNTLRPSGQTAFFHEDTLIANLVSTAYETGSPEVGVYFVAPPSGRVRLTIGGGFRDNGASARDRVFLAPQLFRDSSAGTEVLAPSVTVRGYGSAAENTEFQYGSRVSLLDGLSPGALYYIRTQHLTSAGTDPDTADIASRDIIVIPMP